MTSFEDTRMDACLYFLMVQMHERCLLWRADAEQGHADDKL